MVVQVVEVLRMYVSTFVKKKKINCTQSTERERAHPIHVLTVYIIQAG